VRPLRPRFARRSQQGAALAIVPVSTRVNSVRNDDPELLAPAP